MNAAGEASGEPIAGPVTADENGTWSADIPDSAARPLLVEATGGNYTDEATGATVNVGDRKLSSFLPEGAETSSISPASEVVVRAARRFLATNTGATLEESVESGKTTLRNALGIDFDPLTVTPDANGETLESRQYAAILGGLSQLAENENPDAGNADTDPLDTVIALLDDASDGQVDGQVDGTAVTIEGSSTTLRTDLDADDVTQATTTFTSNPDNGLTDVTSFTVTASATGDGTVSPLSVSVFEGASVAFTLAPNPGSEIGAITGNCPGSLSGNVYDTGALTSACALSVTFDAINYSVTVADVTGGTSSPTSASALFGETVAFELTPDTGYDLISASGCGGLLEGTTFTTGSITADCEIVPVFELQQRQVDLTASPANSGTFDPEGPITVDYGSELAVTLIPEIGFTIGAVDTGGVVGCEGTLSNDVFTFTSVTADCELTASFEPITYTVTGTAIGPGSVAPASTTVNFGDTAALTLTPEAGAGLFDVTAQGCPGSEVAGVYTTGSVTSDCTVTAEFRTLFTITATAGAGGSITPAGDTPALEGEAKQFDVTPDTNFEIDTVTGCGGTLTDSTFITAGITGDCTITATFLENDTPLPSAVWDSFNWDEAVWQ